MTPARSTDNQPAPRDLVPVRVSGFPPVSLLVGQVGMWSKPYATGTLVWWRPRCDTVRGARRSCARLNGRTGRRGDAPNSGQCATTHNPARQFAQAPSGPVGGFQSRMHQGHGGLIYQRQACTSRDTYSRYVTAVERPKATDGIKGLVSL